MTKLQLVEKIRTTIQEWAQQHSIELARLEVAPTGLEKNARIILVARQGFENWSRVDREENLYQRLRSSLGDSDVLTLY